MWKGEQCSCIEMSGLTGELKEWVVYRNLSLSGYLSVGKRKGKEPSWIRETEWYPLVHGQSSDTEQQLCCCSVTLPDPTDCSTPGFPVVHPLPQFTQTHVHRVSDAI